MSCDINLDMHSLGTKKISQIIGGEYISKSDAQFFEAYVGLIWELV